MYRYRSAALPPGAWRKARRFLKLALPIDCTHRTSLTPTSIYNATYGGVQVALIQQAVRGHALDGYKWGP